MIALWDNYKHAVLNTHLIIFSFRLSSIFMSLKIKIAFEVYKVVHSISLFLS